MDRSIRIAEPGETKVDDLSPDTGSGDSGVIDYFSGRIIPARIVLEYEHLAFVQIAMLSVSTALHRLWV